MNHNKFPRWGSAVGISCAIVAGLISTTKITQNKAEWQDWVVVSGCALSCLASSAILAARTLTPIDASYEADDDYSHRAEAEMSYMSWRWAMTYRDFARYRAGAIQSKSSADSLSEYSPRLRRKVSNALRIAAPATQSISIKNCKDPYQTRKSESWDTPF